MATRSQAQNVPSERGRALDWREWNFDGVTQPELVACCYWEYARESAFIRDGLREAADCVRRDVETGNDVDPNGKRPDWCDKLDKIQSIGYPFEVFVRGFCFGRERNWQSADPDAPHYKHPDAPPITGSFPDPWQSLHDEERRARAYVRSFKEQFRLVPVNLAHWCWAKDIASWCGARANEQARLWDEWAKKYLRKDAHGSLNPIPGAPESPRLRDPRPGLFIGSGETLMLEIQWDEFTNDEIAGHFRKVLPALRPHNHLQPDGRGHKPRDVRADLTRLAAMRLLSRYTPVEILGNARRPELADCAPIHKTKQFASDKWGDPTKWRDARREALERFHQLFPFLPADEKPLSWRREK